MPVTIHLEHGLGGPIVAQLVPVFPVGEYPDLITGSSEPAVFWRVALEQLALDAGFPDYQLSECIEVVTGDDQSGWDGYGRLHRSAGQM